MLAKSYYIVFVFLLIGCIDPFEPDLSDTSKQSLLVVDGLLVSEARQQVINLRRSLPISNSTGFLVESGATVTVKDGGNNCFQFTEQREGVYTADSAEFLVELGKEYQLLIKLKDGEEYHSDFQKMLPVQPIDSTWVLQEEETFLVGDFNRNILAVNIYEEISAEAGKYFTQYEYEGTYETESPLQGSELCWRDRAEIPDDLADTLLCYRNEKIRLPLNIFARLEGEFVSGGELKILTLAANRRFERGYSMLIKKSSQTEGFYNFMEQVKAQTNFGGSLFDPPPSEIEGNIVNTNDPSKRALGFFSTRASTSKRIFISGVEVIEDAEGLNCEYDLDTVPPELPPFKSCCDCRLYPNSGIERPDYWPAEDNSRP